MIQNAKQSKAIAYLRQICCSGLGSEIVIPEFLRALHQVVPSGRNWYTCFDDQFNISYQIPDYLIPELVALADISAIVIPGLYSRKNIDRYTAWFNRYPVLANSDVSRVVKGYYQSDFHNLINRKLDQHHMLDARVLHQSRVVGSLTLTRLHTSQPFNTKEHVLCVQLSPYIAHALNSKSDTDLHYADSGQSGLMILNTQGTIQYLSDSASHLLALCRVPVYIFKGIKNDDPVMANIGRLCRHLTAIFEDKAAPPPSWSYTHANGRFTFRACWLNRQQEPGGLIGMTIVHQEPLELKVLRALQNVPLSPVQKEVAAMLAKGFSNDQIGQRLHVKLTTVKDHIRKIFTRLDLYRRDELLPKLLSMEYSNDGVGRIPLVSTNYSQPLH
ncbi:MAG: helix-turn-helix transcriptional regulator [Methylobacter sp.]